MNETVVLAIQTKGEELFQKRKELSANLLKAQEALMKANEALNLNEEQIKDCADFLQENNPDAVKPNWYDYFRVDNSLRPDKYQQ